jgi:menaquinone-dependent protoporphyrinogen oxidase
MSDATKVLMVYGTSYGQTAKIARTIRDGLAAEGFDVELHRGDDPPATFDPAAFDAVVVGASIVLSGHQRYIKRFVAAHRQTLASRPSAFFSVSGSAGSANAEEREEARRIMSRFLDELGWRPDLSTTFAGAIRYTKYNPLIRWVMKRISAKEGASTDTSRDHEYTDWEAVDAFTASIASIVRRSEATAARDGADRARPEPRVSLSLARSDRDRSTGPGQRPELERRIARREVTDLDDVGDQHCSQLGGLTTR